MFAMLSEACCPGYRICMSVERTQREGHIEIQQRRCAEPSQMQVISTISPNFGAQKPLTLFYSNVKANIKDYPVKTPALF